MSCNEWKEYKLGELIDSVSIKHKFDKKEVIFLNTSDILEGKVLHKNYSEVDGLPGQAKKSIKKDDILFSEIRPKNKRFAYIDFDADDYVVSTKLMVLRRKDNRIDNKFLYSYLTSEKTLEYLQTIAESRSGTFPQITFNELKIMDIKLPPIEEQEKIADILSSLDDKIQLNNEMNKTLEEMAQALFKRWFVDFEFPNENGEPYKSSGGEMVESELGMIPKGWEVKSLKNLINLTMGLSPKSSSYNNDRIGMQLLNGAADFNNTNIIPTKYTTDPKRICNVGDIIFCIRGTIGNITFADDTYCLGRGVASLSPINDIDRGIIFLNLNLMLDKLKANASGSVILGISKSDIEDSKIIVSNKILREKFNGIFKSIYDDIKNFNEESNNLIKLRDTLLPKLMSGEIRVK